MNPPSRDLIRRIVFDPGFWDGYRETDDDLPEWTSDVRLLTAGERTLGIEVRFNPNVMRVVLRHGDAELPQLGYDDAADVFLPWIFRWEELDRIARLAALRDEDLRHPGAMVALLSRFTPVTSPEELAVARPVLAAALRTLGSGPNADYHLSHWDSCEAQGGYRWIQDGAGWVLDGEYTMRERVNPEFPHRDLAIFMGDVQSALEATVEPGWRVLARKETEPAELARRLREAGCEHPVILRALTDPIDPYETAWVLDLLRG